MMIGQKLNRSNEKVMIKPSEFADLSELGINDIYRYIVNNSSNELNFYWLGKREYQVTWDLQNRLQEKVKNDNMNGVVLFLEHNAVYTMGKNADKSNLLPIMPDNIQVIETDRGGDVTYHGPGQLVGYPIIDLKKYNRSIPAFMRGLEIASIAMLSNFGISADTKEGLTGVWHDNKKIVALGVRLSKWVSMHGFAVNVSIDLRDYRGIIPCGISEYGVTSIEKIRGKKYSLQHVSELMIAPLKKMLKQISKGSEHVKV